MEPFEDYYKILQVDFSAYPEVIDGAYRRLAKKYFPIPGNKTADEKKMTKINVAYTTLSDPERRKNYDVEWMQRKSGTVSSAGTHTPTQPKPIVDPKYIQFRNVKPGMIKRASFLIINAGGSYSNIWVDNPDSWVRITSWRSLAPSDELPLRVYIEAQGKDWSKVYSENIRVRLDSVEAQVKVELHTQLFIKDHKWRDIDYDDLKGWVKKRKDRLDAGEELKGKIFRYRLNRSTGRYQVRLRHSYDKAVYDPFH